jgi:chaperonin GroES
MVKKNISGGKKSAAKSKFGGAVLLGKETPSSASKKSRIQPLGDRVLVKPLSEEETGKKSPLGIIIPETVDREKPAQGRVIAVGEGRIDEKGNLIPVRVTQGDRVVFSKYSPDELKFEGEEYFILNESSILAVIN